MKESLRAFLYILLRDHLTLGEAEGIMGNVTAAQFKTVSFSNSHLIAYVDFLIARLAGVTLTGDPFVSKEPPCANDSAVNS